MNDSFDITYTADVYTNEKAGRDTSGIFALLLWILGLAQQRKR